MARKTRHTTLGRAAARVATALAGLALAAGLVVAPTLADGYTALQWTRHYAVGFGSERPFERVRQTARWAVRAIDTLAPLPAAGEAAALALQTARRFAAEQPTVAQALYTDVHAVLARQQATGWRGWGLGPVTAEAAALARIGAAPVAATAESAGETPSSALSASPSPAPSVSPSPSPSGSPAAASAPAPRATPEARSTPRPQPTPRRKLRPRRPGVRP